MAQTTRCTRTSPSFGFTSRSRQAKRSPRSRRRTDSPLRPGRARTLEQPVVWRTPDPVPGAGRSSVVRTGNRHLLPVSTLTVVPNLKGAQLRTSAESLPYAFSDYVFPVNIIRGSRLLELEEPRQRDFQSSSNASL